MVSKAVRTLLMALVAVASLFSFASAQDYPSKPIHVVVPFGPGTGPDVLARVVARQLETQLKQSIVIENRGGANGTIGTRVVALAPPDGYTLLYMPTAFSINPSVYRNLPFDTRKDFVPVADIGLGIGLFLLVNPKLPVTTVPELIEYGKTHPLAFGSPGVGNSLHLAGELFNVRTGLKMVHVPFNATGAISTALLAGDIQVLFIAPAAAHAYVKSGNLRALAFTGTEPYPQFPEVPLISEYLKDFIGSGWHGFLAPAGTPRAIVEFLNAEIRKAVTEPKVAEMLLDGGYRSSGMNATQFATYLDGELTRWAEAARAAGIEPH
jgi:tripartite-type tricarboxylate transporter receptor subunit TctC